MTKSMGITNRRLLEEMAGAYTDLVANIATVNKLQTIIASKDDQLEQKDAMVRLLTRALHTKERELDTAQSVIGRLTMSKYERIRADRRELERKATLPQFTSLEPRK